MHMEPEQETENRSARSGASKRKKRGGGGGGGGPPSIIAQGPRLSKSGAANR